MPACMHACLLVSPSRRILSSSRLVPQFKNLPSFHFAGFRVSTLTGRMLPSGQFTWFPAMKLMGGFMLLLPSSTIKVYDRFQLCVFFLPGPYVFVKISLVLDLFPEQGYCDE